MVNKIKKNKIIPIILQILKKQKLILKISYKEDKITIVLLEFLWLHKLICGFKIQRHCESIIIYLKNNEMNTNLKCDKYKHYNNINTLKKKQKWFKNSFFIIKTTKGILTIKQCVTIKIGGFLLYKFF